MALTDKLTAIADAIRAKDGTTGVMTLAEMPSKIAAIQTGGGGGGGGVSLADVDVYVADFYTDEVAVTAGALDVYKRIIIS